MRRVLLIASVLLGSSGCGLMTSNRVEPSGPRLGDIVRKLPAVGVRDSATAAQPSRPAVLDRYRALETRIEDPALAWQVSRRVAQLEALVASDQLVDGEDVNMQRVANQLQQVLDEAADHEEALDDLRYRLAKALDFEGDEDRALVELGRLITDASVDPDVRTEARFRRGEMYFSRGEYALAAEDYAQIAGTQTSYRLHAGYMLGWSRFKQNEFAGALGPMLETMDRLLARQGELARSQQELLEDTERITLITLDYLDGPATLATAMAERERPPWQTRLYEALGSWYRDKGRFTDSARSWQTFLEQNPLHRDAPAIVLQVIETHREAGFVAQIPPWELRFVESFHRHSEYVAVHGEQAFDEYRPRLRAFMDRIVTRHHAQAQDTDEAEQYLAAAAWYRRWLRNFPADEAAPRMHLLLAEALEDGGEDGAALTEYRQVVKRYADSPEVKEAAYAVIVVLRDMASAKRTLAESRAEAATDFASRFPNDARAGNALVESATLMLDAHQWSEAARLAGKAMALGLSGDNRRTAALVAAHSRFELGEFDSASNRYRRLLRETPDDEGLRDRLLASVFNQAAARETTGDVDAAMELYLSLTEIDPDSELAKDARFDVAAMRESVGDLTGAAQDLEAFREMYPDHPGTPSIPPRLVALYESMERPAAAAAELIAIHDRGIAEPDVARSALYRAGELLLEAEDTAGAIVTFRRYAHGYERPVGLRLEAMHHMDQLYQRTSQPAKRRYWLRKKIDTVEALANAEIEARFRYLAADAALVLARDKRNAFEAIALDPPLARSVGRKQGEMQAALDRYRQVTQYQVASLTSRATLEMARMYESLAAALMTSARPDGLNEMERSQYELLLEEQAFPFEEKAIDLHEANLRRGWQAGFDASIDASLDSLRSMVPGRFERPMVEVAHASTFY